MHDRPLYESEYDTDEDAISRFVPEPDPVSKALGSAAYLQHHTVQECVERFGDGPVARFPEVFDRFYFLADGGPVLVDVLMDGTPGQLEEERARKRVAFKARWCKENDRRYIAVPESDSQHPDRVRALLDPGSQPPTEPRSAARTRPAQARAARSRVQRPSATAA